MIRTRKQLNKALAEKGYRLKDSVKFSISKPIRGQVILDFDGTVYSYDIAEDIASRLIEGLGIVGACASLIELSFTPILEDAVDNCDIEPEPSNSAKINITINGVLHSVTISGDSPKGTVLKTKDFIVSLLNRL